MVGQYSISDLIPFISWEHLYYTWHVSHIKEASEHLKFESLQLLESMEKDFLINYLLQKFDVDVDNETLIVHKNSGPMNIPFLRQQLPGESDFCLCLTDFILEDKSYVYCFATSVDKHMESSFGNDLYKNMLAKTLADRLAEACADLLQKEMKIEGIRPAVGYPSIPDMSINFLLDELCGFKQIGIELTNNGMMIPHASVSGFIIDNPQSNYFRIGKISEDQLSNYARKRGYDVEQMKKFIYA